MLKLKRGLEADLDGVPRMNRILAQQSKAVNGPFHAVIE
jgi:hypothetical protein